jgi:hypothetical protein
LVTRLTGTEGGRGGEKKKRERETGPKTERAGSRREARGETTDRARQGRRETKREETQRDTQRERERDREAQDPDLPHERIYRLRMHTPQRRVVLLQLILQIESVP